MENLIKRYTTTEEVLNTTTHAIGLLMCVVVCICFFVSGSLTSSLYVPLSLSLYAFGVLTSYAASTIYHAIPASKEKAKSIARKFDHAAIYWHIAGSYSPIILIGMYGGGEVTWAYVIFFFVWLCAVVGTSLSFRKMKSHSYFETICYVLMGLTILVAFKPFYETCGFEIVMWAVAEGVSYIVGAVLYSFKKVRFIHSVFHVFVLLGDICHMVAVWKVLEMFVL